MPRADDRGVRRVETLDRRTASTDTWKLEGGIVWPARLETTSPASTSVDKPAAEAVRVFTAVVFRRLLKRFPRYSGAVVLRIIPVCRVVYIHSTLTFTPLGVAMGALMRSTPASYLASTLEASTGLGSFRTRRKPLPCVNG